MGFLWRGLRAGHDKVENQHRSPEQQPHRGCDGRRAVMWNRRSLIHKRPSTVASACALAAQGYGKVRRRGDI